MQCIHYFTTWDFKLPMGCRFYEIKSKSALNLKVLEMTGQECLGFEIKPTNTPTKKLGN